MTGTPAFRHSCLFALRGALDDRLMRELDRFSARFLADFPGITRYRFAPNLSRRAGRHVLVLYSEFVDEAAFRAYVASPLHDEIAAFLAPLVEETLIADIVC
jgi:quinol monooxygenase YgiN